jgi:cysteine dioxygenase
MNFYHEPAQFEEICESLRLLTQPLTEDQIRALLESIAPCVSGLSQFARFSDTSYCRNRILRSEALDLLLLCWKPGQRTPIHDHSGSICGVHVVRGEALEIGFTPSGVGLMVPSDCKRLSAGDITVSRDSEAHMMANVASTSQDLVTLHCYSPPLDSMRIFSESETFFTDYSAIVASATTSGCYHVRP